MARWRSKDGLLRGVKEISRFLCGDESLARTLYYYISLKRFPAFTLGGAMYYAREETLLNWIRQQELANAGGSLHSVAIGEEPGDDDPKS